MRITPDAFEEWASHPITERYLAKCAQMAEQARADWTDISWEGGSSDPVKLARLRGRAEGFNQASNISLEELSEE